MSKKINPEQLEKVVKEYLTNYAEDIEEDVKNTTDSALLDLFATIGAMRNRDENEIIQKFELAFQEDPLGAMRCLFYSRDIREGLGERRVFRVILPYIAEKHTEELKHTLGFIPEYGRWDDF